VSIQKKSLVRALKTTKKANVASAPVGKKTASMGRTKVAFGSVKLMHAKKAI
jgi:hypothetical protein